MLEACALVLAILQTFADMYNAPNAQRERLLKRRWEELMPKVQSSRSRHNADCNRHVVIA